MRKTPYRHQTPGITRSNIKPDMDKSLKWLETIFKPKKGENKDGTKKL